MSVTKIFKEKPDENSVHFVILGSQYGYRMKSFGSCAVLSCGDRSLLDENLDTILNFYKVPKVTLVTHFRSDELIEKYPHVRIVECANYPTLREEVRVGLNAVVEDNVVFIRGNVLFPRLQNFVTHFGNFLFLCEDSRCDFSVVEEGERVSKLTTETSSWTFPYCWTLSSSSKAKFRKLVNGRGKEFIVELLNKLFPAISYRAVKTAARVFLEKGDLG